MSDPQGALSLHAYYRGKVQMMPKCAVRGFDDFAVWYTPGVAAACRAIAQDGASAYQLTNKGNTVAIVSDGTRVLGLGDIGPQAALPVMEGKALLFKYLGGVDAVPICLRTSDEDELVRVVKLLEPSFGAINLEDIAQPKCFSVLDTLRSELEIPVWHDDQQGTAAVVLAALVNALKIVGKELGEIRLAMVGAGAANVATYRLLESGGIDPAHMVVCDSKGILHAGRNDIERAQERFADKWRMCRESNAAQLAGGIEQAVNGADVLIAFSTPDATLIRPQWIRTMADKPVVFACANPTPEIWPADAKAAGAAVVATGRSDFPNQVNNSLCFPGMFRGVLDVRSRAITDEMAMAVAFEIAACAEERGLSENAIVPRMDDYDLHARVAVAAGLTAQRQGRAGVSRSATVLYDEAALAMRNARDAVQVLMSEELIPAPPKS